MMRTPVEPKRSWLLLYALAGALVIANANQTRASDWADEYGTRYCKDRRA